MPDPLPPPPPQKGQLTLLIDDEIARATGKVYSIVWGLLDMESLREVLRLVRDLEHERDAAVRRARMEPWRR